MFVPASTIRHHVTNQTDSQNAGALPGDDASHAGRRHRPTGRWIDLSEQIAADLLPEAGDPGTVDGGEGR
jgi:hypothetical protein